MVIFKLASSPLPQKSLVKCTNCTDQLSYEESMVHRSFELSLLNSSLFQILFIFNEALSTINFEKYFP